MNGERESWTTCVLSTYPAASLASVMMLLAIERDVLTVSTPIQERAVVVVDCIHTQRERPDNDDNVSTTQRVLNCNLNAVVHLEFQR